MLSYLGGTAELAHRQDCKQIESFNSELISHICSTFCPIANCMCYIAKALTSRPTSAKSMVSFPSTQPSLIREESTLEEPSEGESPPNDTRATSFTSESKTRIDITASVKNKSRTVFQLAHPPPISIHKQHLHIRPRVLLQLQKISDSARPTPVLEVLPSIVCASRLARRFPRTFKGKAGLGADDLVVVGSEDYKSDESEVGDNDSLFEGEKWDKREIVAAIRQPCKDETGAQAKGEICMNNGSSWTVSRLGSGAYEFVSVDDHGLRTLARWVPKHLRGNQRASTPGKDSSIPEDKKFSFSLLNPNSRRHAIIACLDRHCIDVSDQYVDPQMTRRDTASSTATSLSSPTSEDFPAKDPVEVGHSLRALIIVTGIYVAFNEGFSSLFRRCDTAPSSPILSSKHQRRSLSLASNQYLNDQKSSAAKSTFSNMQRARASLQRTKSSSGVPLSQGSPPVTTTQRTTSSGGAFIERIKSHNMSAIKSNELGKAAHSGVERAQTDYSQNGPLSPRLSTNISPGMGHSSALDSDCRSGLDHIEEASSGSQGGKKRTRRLSRIFGLSRRTSGVA